MEKLSRYLMEHQFLHLLIPPLV